MPSSEADFSGEPSANVFQRHRVLTLVLINVALITPVVIGGLYIKHSNRSPSRKIRTQVTPYHHGIIPNSSAVGTFGPNRYLMHSNSLGFVDASERQVPLQTDKHRVLFLGDSFTEGLGLPWEETFVGRVAQALAPQDIEVLNAGVSSYSPIIYWRKLKYLLEEVGLQVSEVVVFIDISDAQDEAEVYDLDARGFVVRRNSASQNQDSSQKAQSSLLKEAYLDPTGAILPSDNDDKATSERYRINVTRGLWTVREDLFEQYGKVGLERMAKYMSDLHGLARKHGLPLTIAVYPWPDQVRSKDLNSIQARFWRTWAENHDVAFINYFPHVMDGDQDSWRTTIPRLFIRGSVHWNAAGHALIAEVFLQHYRNTRRH
ncbi:MAG: GDSL-type esterase/lipase family protein [Myxococcota bacterium]